MNEQNFLDYKRIAAAIDYISANFRLQPNLEELAAKVHLSPSHFQRLFTEWAGTSPKKFLQYISIQHAKRMLNTDSPTLFETTIETGLSSTSRLHDLFISIEGMTPGEYKSGGNRLLISYSFTGSPFGNLIVASTSKGICYMAFEEEVEKALERLQEKFPNAVLRPGTDDNQHSVRLIFQEDWSELPKIKLHLKGTPFQLKVWETLLKIPMGRLSTYGNIAGQIGNPAASRAVGSAVGSNPVAFLIPCHRVIQSSGIFGGYMWGTTRKTAMIGWESAKIYDHESQ